MQLNITTDYAVRVLIGLAQAQRRVSASELSERHNVPRTYISKIMVSLKEQGWLSVKGGARGGYMLAVPPGEITLKQVFAAMSDEFVLCPCGAGDCAWSGADGCAMRRIYRQLQQRVDAMLDGVTLETLACRAPERAPKQAVAQVQA